MTTVGGSAPYTVTQVGEAGIAGTSVTTTATTYADIDATNAAVTLTTTGGILVAELCCNIRNNTTATHGMTVALSLDGATEVGAILVHSAVIGVFAAVTVRKRFTGVAAGSHTVKGRWFSSSAGDTLECQNRWLTVEELKR